ncbi:hypothetical protein PV327_010234 [Microctonus hyperodae]|uniref:Hyccin n=1 Tax=Microctonus hyperodae TaxID=165561 RepID=A0AA39FRQ6_MICHY|nr:hypothetical protein PV327_010234 [Microctonus hyperodae]
MTESLINEWLADCADISTTELQTFANTLSQDNEIVRALYMLLEERSKYSELVDTVCNQMFSFYRSREIELQRFTLQFVPTLIFIYLNSVAHGDIKNCRSVETLLICLYNLEVVDELGRPKAVSFRLPSLAMLSIYHEPSSLAPASLTESAIRRFEECNSKLVSWGPLQQVETLNAQNRLKVMTALLFIYNQQLSFINKSALEQLCKVATKLVTQGFTKPGHHQRSSYSESSFVPRLLPRIPVSNQFLLEFLHGIYFSMYNDCWYVGTQAVEDIHNRACYDGYSDVLLVTNAIRNSSSTGPSGQLNDGSMGISVALSPATTTPTISKSMITNASFRTKKLPDDIPIVAKEDSDGESKPNLVSITEEQDGSESNRVGSIRQSKDMTKSGSKITNFSLSKKPKEKDGKSMKNGYVSAGEKEKKSSGQGVSRDNLVKSNRVIALNNESDMDGANGGSIIKKKIDSNLGNNDASTSINNDTEHHLSMDPTDNIDLDISANLRSHNDQDQHVSSVQISKRNNQ